VGYGHWKVLRCNSDPPWVMMMSMGSKLAEGQKRELSLCRGGQSVPSSPDGTGSRYHWGRRKHKKDGGRVFHMRLSQPGDVGGVGTQVVAEEKHAWGPARTKSCSKAPKLMGEFGQKK